MKFSEIFRRAARRIEKGRNSFCCYAIEDQYDVDLEERIPARNYFLDIYGHRNKPDIGVFGKADIKANQDRRVIALCLAAAIAESEGL